MLAGNSKHADGHEWWWTLTYDQHAYTRSKKKETFYQNEFPWHDKLIGEARLDKND